MEDHRVERTVCRQAFVEAALGEPMTPAGRDTRRRYRSSSRTLASAATSENAQRRERPSWGQIAADPAMHLPSLNQRESPRRTSATTMPRDGKMTAMDTAEQIELGRLAPRLAATPPGLGAPLGIESPRSAAPSTRRSPGQASTMLPRGRPRPREARDGPRSDAIEAFSPPRGAYPRFANPKATPSDLSGRLERRGFTRLRVDASSTPIRRRRSQSSRRAGAPERGATTSARSSAGYELEPFTANWLAELPNELPLLPPRHATATSPGRGRAVRPRGGRRTSASPATRPEHRRKGPAAAAPSRIREPPRPAAALDTETGERIPLKPSNSYRNILRFGFEEAYLRPELPRRRRAPPSARPVGVHVVPHPLAREPLLDVAPALERVELVCLLERPAIWR